MFVLVRLVSVVVLLLTYVTPDFDDTRAGETLFRINVSS